MILNETFHALNKEAQFTKELLGSGATLIRKANFASKGTYFQAFSSLSIGLERIGKLCLIIDYYIDNSGQFPSKEYLKNQINHKLKKLYDDSETIIQKRNLSLNFIQKLNDPIYSSIIEVLHNFAMGDRYANFNLLAGDQTNDPIKDWFNKIDTPLYNSKVSNLKKQRIARDAELISSVLENYSSVLFTYDNNIEITSIKDASLKNGIYSSIAQYRQLYLIHIIRYWIELLSLLQNKAQELGRQDIPFFSEIFAIFYNEDAYIKTRKTWLNL